MLDDIQTRIYSRLKNKYPTTMLTKYPNTLFTISDRVPETPQFPTVYIHEMSTQELARDLAGTTINAIRSNFQIEVTDNESITNVNEVMSYVVSTMKSLRYEVVSMPEFKNTQDVYRKVARFRRVIGAYDVL